LTQEDYLNKLNKKTRELFKKASEIRDEVIPTASFGINLTIGGGLVKGHQHTFWGNETAGKSALMLQTIGLAQKAGLNCAYIDAERRFRADWAKKLGVDTEALDVSRIRGIPEFADAGMDLMRAGVDLIVVDSISALLPEMFFDEHGEVQGFDSTRTLGRFSFDMGKACRMHLAEAHNTAIVHISQLRRQPSTGTTPKPDIPTGGQELRHRDSLRIKLTSSGHDSYAIKDDVVYGDNVITEAVGRPVNWLISKNGLTGQYGDGSYDFYNRGSRPPGVDRLSEIIEYGKRYGVIEGTTWLTVYGEKFQGKKNLNKHLLDHPEIAEKLEAEIFAKSI
jgi:recombination protein RecA